MGANAQTSVPTFTAGDVLTAANMNISARTGVPVFADTTARDAAFGGTGEKTLAEGQLCYVENLTGVAQLQYYDGSTWNSLTAGGLVRITSQSYTASASISVNNVFSTTYRNYLILVNNDGSAGEAASIRLRVGGVDNSTANSYRRQRWAVTAGVGAGNDLTGSSIQVLLGSANDIGNAVTVFNPALAIETSFLGHSGLNGDELHLYYGRHNQTVAYDGFTMIFTNNQTGTVDVYGYAIA